MLYRVYVDSCRWHLLERAKNQHEYLNYASHIVKNNLEFFYNKKTPHAIQTNQFVGSIHFILSFSLRCTLKQ